MGPHEAPHLNYPENLWLDWFMDGIMNPDIDETGARSILHYLIDLNILEFGGDDSLKLFKVRQGQSSDEVRSALLETLDGMSQTESGFALIYFFSSCSTCFCLAIQSAAVPSAVKLAVPILVSIKIFPTESNSFLY